MKVFFFATSILFFVSGVHAETPCGSCPNTSASYQRAYEIGGQSKDLVCFQTALEREMSGSVPYECPFSAQHYQDEYTTGGQSSDLVCYQVALQRELE